MGGCSTLVQRSLLLLTPTVFLWTSLDRCIVWLQFCMAKTKQTAKKTTSDFASRIKLTGVPPHTKCRIILKLPARSTLQAQVSSRSAESCCPNSSPLTSPPSSPMEVLNDTIGYSNKVGKFGWRVTVLTPSYSTATSVMMAGKVSAVTSVHVLCAADVWACWSQFPIKFSLPMSTSSVQAAMNLKIVFPTANQLRIL